MRFLIALIGLTAILLPGLAAAERRVALVIGNSDYQAVAPLANPKRDAAAVAAKLRALDFEVIEGYDLDIYSLQQSVRSFSREARTADITLFFYAGHGLGIGGKNYLVPVDARFEDPAALEFETVKLDTVMRQMQASNGASLVFLDACRDDPAMTNAVSRSLSTGTRSVSVGQGLVAVEVPDNGKGTAIAFATSPGDVAFDGDGLHSPFTAALLEHIDRPNTALSEIMAYVNGDVRNATNQRQKPWYNQSLTAPVVLNRVTAPLAAPVTSLESVAVPPDATSAAVPDLAAQKALFDVAVQSDREEDYRVYLQVFPGGLFALNARAAIDRLSERSDPEPESPPARAATLAVEEPSGPLRLVVTEALRAMPATPETEKALDMDSAKRREVQARLLLSQANVGAPDGDFGPNTRRGISAWQTGKGLVATSYLNAAQLQLLMADTEAAWQTWSAANPVPAARPSSAGAVARQPARQPKPQVRISPNDVLLGAGAAILLKRLSR